ncbi:MAG: hypothetical protein A2Y62_10420 [Candidatus Fischerbacteria bacterium RBG_13_37_8]|uniref:Transposase zinc-ribbon domain-containing protein n=1 Tax=Candidatus Fischerbacteria bacterium RBG_13_37_8 TaxID=1817863 RepID=A0A1F5V7R6_9BACT|nr:MAG: hypothetical protein A2Y62_10420 [Candidatus Fischerbacteria bacterium RBG_13_37_8]
MKIFHSEEKCLEYLANCKWGKNGWQCRKCFNKTYSFITTRKQIKCNRCGYYESFIANTVMHKSRKPLSEWFWVIYTIATSKMGISATEADRQLNFEYYIIARTRMHKILITMLEAIRIPLKRDVEVHESYVFRRKGRKDRKMEKQSYKISLACKAELSDEGSVVLGFEAYHQRKLKASEILF